MIPNSLVPGANGRNTKKPNSVISSNPKKPSNWHKKNYEMNAPTQIQLSEQSAQQWLMDGRAYKHPHHGMVTKQVALQLVQKECNGLFPQGIGEAYTTGTSIEWARKVCPGRINATLLRWVEMLSNRLACNTSMTTEDHYHDAVKALHQFSGLRLYEVRLLFRMIVTGQIRPAMANRFMARELTECIEQYLDQRTQYLARNKNRPDPEFQNVQAAANRIQGASTVQKLIEDLQLEDRPEKSMAKWIGGGTLSDHERQQIRQAAQRHSQSQAKEQSTGSTEKEDACTNEKEG
jgi:hypothetical protein